MARFVYVGTYTAPDVPPGGTHPSVAVGIYVFRLDPTDGGLTPLHIVPAPNPSFVALNPTQTHLYSVNENPDPTAGSVSAYSINATNGTLTLLNTASSNGAFPTHINVHPSGQYFYAANYGTGNFPVYRINANGSIGTMTGEFQSVGNGTGPNPARQDGPHAHQILTDLDGGHVFGVDLGADKVNVLNLNLGTGLFSANIVPFVPVASGSGSRHMAFHPDRKHAYVLDELVSITVFDYEPVRGGVSGSRPSGRYPTTSQVLTPLPKSVSIRAGSSSITPTGAITASPCTALTQITGELDVIGRESTRGEWPRGMNIDPSGAFLYAANQNTDTIAVFRIQPSNGKLKFSTLVNTPTPVDVEFGSLA